MTRSGSQPGPGGSKFGRWGKGRAGRKSKRKWTPEPGSGKAPSWRPPPEPPRSYFYDDVPPRPPTRKMPPVDRPTPTADDAPTGAVPMGRSGYPPRGARPYPPPNDPSARRTEPVRREPPRTRRDVPPVPPGGYYDDYERYDTGGYAGEPRHPAPEPPKPESAQHGTTAAAGAGSLPRLPKKLTVTRVAALRGRQLTGQAVGAFQRATKADGADKSGLTALTYAVLLNYASDAAMMIALANTLFISPTSADSSKGKVALYLLVTIAPFALVAPVIGPALDRIQRGRRLAMCVASAGQALMAVIMALHFDDWILYPAALGMMVLSKSFTVLKAAVTPRVVPPEITLSKTNARLTVFGLVGGGVFGALAAGVNAISGSAGALWFTALICVVAAVQSMRIPSWVEATEGEVPASLSAHPEKKKRQPMGRQIVVSLWGNGSVRVLTGFLLMFAAFAVKAQHENSGESAFTQLLLLGSIGAAAGVGGFVGNALGSRLHFGKPDQVILGCVGACVLATLLATLMAGVATAALVGLIGAMASALAKISLDAVIQEDLPEESRASAFGRSETVLQLSWCFGGVIGLLLPPTYWIGFLVVTVLLSVGLVQTMLVHRGTSLVPGLGGDRPLRPDQTGSTPVPGAARGPAPSRNWPGS
ncbi:MFS transporter [Amycolatopsis anabasis]|uniref:MFS transporter n=1 Tax=Amycolatopsis anabasis TaxID=1840409 RepID=UPI00131E15CB|nr:MFS transporter [Amycolatopsis anabasis]